MNYREALAWLYSLQRFGIKLGLENSRRLFRELSRSGGLQSAVRDLEIALPWKVIHVAGTNGKGSVCAMIDSILCAEGYRSGLFTSPHLVSFRERIRANSEVISEEAVASGLVVVRELICDWELHPTFFEVTTALALKHFSETNVDIAVLETGLGGRLDATNALQSDVAVITPIALDHQKWLGQTLAEIAAEKAGIIKSQAPVVCAIQAPEAEKMIRARATECGAPLQFVSEPHENSPIALRGSYQKQNAALAIAALRAARIDVSDSAIARGLAAVEWPARFQVWDERTIIDGAHNPAAARVLAQTWRETFSDERATLILAVLSDKDLLGICEAFMPIVDLALLPQVRSERAGDPAELAQTLRNLCGTGASLAGNRRDCPTISVAASIADALVTARARPNRILITGSLHFAGEALAYLQGKPASFEECAQ